MTAQTPNPDPLLTRHEAADYLTISLRLLDRLRTSGDLIPTRLGRSVRYRVSELERYLDTQSAPAQGGRHG